MSSVPPDPLVGHTFDGRYVIRSRIARGGMAVVYVANDLRLERRVAIKVMHAHLAEDENFTRRFEQEARSAAGLQHPNVVSVFDQGHDAGLPYLVMEYLPGITLRELLKQQHHLTHDQAYEIGDAVLAGLAAAHQAGIVHRDLKPENVLLADDGQIKIGDFGLARAVSANTTTGQALLGTIAYLSPELVTRGVADARSDLYAFGIMLFEMLTGSQPFTGEQPMQIAYQHAHSEVPAPSTLTKDSSPELDELVLWTTQREPANRPRDAGEALEHLRGLRHGEITATMVLPTTSMPSAGVTPSTTVLSDLQRSELASGAQAGPGASPVPGDTGLERDAQHSTAAAVPASRRASIAGKQRMRRGRFIGLALALLIVLAGGAGWWWGQGPGSLVTIPAVEGLDPAAAQATLEDLSLEVTPTECSSLTVEVGLAVSTRPKAGTRVKQGGPVSLCVSTGPQLLDVPPLIGMSLEEAQQAIEDAKFTFGAVTEQWFDGGTVGTVLLATDSEGNGLDTQFPERGTINLIVSAGSVPDVSGRAVAEGTKILQDRGLTVDDTLRSEAHSEDIDKDLVLGVNFAPDRQLRVGDAVGLQISLGPELVTIPEVRDMPLQEAMNLLSSLGLEPTTTVLDILRPAAVATGTKPGAGEQVRKGSTVQVRAKVDF